MSYRDLLREWSVPDDFDPVLGAAELEHQTAHVLRQHPEIGQPAASERAKARLIYQAWVKHRNKPQTVYEVTDGKIAAKWRKAKKLAIWILVAFALLIGWLTLLTVKAYGQVDCVKWVNADNSAAGTFCAPFSVKAGSNITLSKSGTTMTITAAAAASTLFSALSSSTNTTATMVIGSGASLAASGTGANKATHVNTTKFTNNESLGQIPIGQGDGTATWSDPLVQGTQAAGSATIPNPVSIGGSDYAGTPALRTWKVDSSGSGYAVITFASPQHVIVDSGTITAVTAITNALPAGSNVIGHVIADTGSTTAVTGNVASTVADGANVTLGAKADAKSTATDTTAITAMSVLKQISASVQAPPSQAVTNAGTFQVQVSSAPSTAVTNAGTFAVQAAEADGANVTLGAKTDAKSTATDTTSISAMSVLKQISASVQAPPSQAVTNAGTFATQSAITAASGSIASGAIASGAVASGAVASGAFASGSISDGADVTLGAKGDAKSTATDTTAVSAMSVLKEISAMEQAPASRAVTNAGTFAVQAAISGSISNTSFAATGASTPTDAFANPTTALVGQVFPMGWNGSTWDRLYAETNGNDAEAVVTAGNLSVEGHNMIFNGTSYDRVRSATIGNSAPALGLTVNVPYGQYNSTAPVINSTGTYSALQIDPMGRLQNTDTQVLDILSRMYRMSLAPTPKGTGTVLKGTFGQPIQSTNGALNVYNRNPTDPCEARKGNVAISQTATTKLVSGQPGQRIIVCYARVVAGAAEIASLWEGTGTNCGTSTLAVTGSTTAANGESYSANGGMSAGNGQGTVASTSLPGNDLCLAQSGSNRLAGNITYVFAP